MESRHPHRIRFGETGRAVLGAALLSFGIAHGIAQWRGFPTPDVPRARDGSPILTAPAPKMADGKPDLSGVWSSKADYFRNLASDLNPPEAPMLPWAKAQVAEHEARDHQDDPMALCMPPGVPRINTSAGGDALHPFKIVQTPRLIILLYETSVNSTFRQIFLDGRSVPRDVQPTWLGYSVGRWDGNTLVVDTIGFNGRAWLDTAKGHPQSEAAHVTERFTRRDLGHMELNVTIDDPKSYSKPWSAKIPVTLLPDAEIIETVCENEKDSRHQGYK